MGHRPASALPWGCQEEQWAVMTLACHHLFVSPAGLARLCAAEGRGQSLLLTEAWSKAVPSPGPQSPAPQSPAPQSRAVSRLASGLTSDFPILSPRPAHPAWQQGIKGLEAVPGAVDEGTGGGNTVQTILLPQWSWPMAARRQVAASGSRPTNGERGSLP